MHRAFWGPSLWMARAPPCAPLRRCGGICSQQGLNSCLDHGLGQIRTHGMQAVGARVLKPHVSTPLAPQGDRLTGRRVCPPPGLRHRSVCGAHPPAGLPGPQHDPRPRAHERPAVPQDPLTDARYDPGTRGHGPRRRGSSPGEVPYTERAAHTGLMCPTLRGQHTHRPNVPYTERAAHTQA